MDLEKAWKIKNDGKAAIDKLTDFMADHTAGYEYIDISQKADSVISLIDSFIRDAMENRKVVGIDPMVPYMAALEGFQTRSAHYSGSFVTIDPRGRCVVVNHGLPQEERFPFDEYGRYWTLLGEDPPKEYAPGSALDALVDFRDKNAGKLPKDAVAELDGIIGRLGGEK